MVAVIFSEVVDDQAYAHCTGDDAASEYGSVGSCEKKDGQERFPILVDRILRPDSEDQCGRQFQVPGDLTVGQFVRGLRKRLKLTDSSLHILVNSSKPSSATNMSTLFAAHKSPDGVLVVSCRSGSPLIVEKKVFVKGEDESLRRSHHEWSFEAKEEGDNRSWEASPRNVDDAGMFELTRIVSEKEMLARKRFQQRMNKRAAGPRESSEAPSNLVLAQAMANCKLDTMVSGMIEVAVKRSTSPNTAPISVSLCGSPCVARVSVR
eukprot:28588-Rhodomonas_salina.1